MAIQPRNILKQLSFNTFIPYFYPALMLSLKHWRKKAISMMRFHPGDRVLIPGVGSGHDLPFLPDDIMVEGVDISDVMLKIARAKVRLYGIKNANLSIMDAENLQFDDNSFDKAILGLFLTCVFDPRKAFAEVVRVVKPGGQILIYDHLVKEKRWSREILQQLDLVMKYSFCSIVRRFEDIIDEQPVTLQECIPGDPVGFVKGFLLSKNTSEEEVIVADPPKKGALNWFARLIHVG